MRLPMQEQRIFLLDEKGLPLNSYYTIFPFPFPVLICVVFRYLLNLFCYLFLGYPLKYRFHFSVPT